MFPAGKHVGKLENIVSPVKMFVICLYRHPPPLPYTLYANAWPKAPVTVDSQPWDSKFQAGLPAAEAPA